jgi:membrane-bound serine protease (ClpP class)
VFLIFKVIQIRSKKKAIGIFIGETATTIDRLTPEKTGFVRFKGEYWRAKSNTIIEPKTKVVIIDKDESTLVVKTKEIDRKN